MAYGMIGHVGIGKETSWGSAVAVTDYIEALSENLSLTLERYETKNIYGGYYEPDDATGTKRVAGDLVFAGHPVSIGHFLKGVMGVNSGSVVLSGFLFRNDFTFSKAEFSNESPTPPYTFEIFRDVTSSFRYDGVVVSRLAMSLAPNQDLRCTAGLIGRSASVVAKTTPTFPSSPIYPFAFDTASMQIAGAGVSTFNGLNLVLDNQLEGIPLMNGSAVVARMRRRGPQMLGMSGTLEFDNLTEYNNFVNQTEQVMKLTLSRTASFQLVIDIPRFVYTAYPMGMPGRERLTVSFEGKARYHTGSAQTAMLSLTTTNSTY